ncbi:MAG: DegT/DnrJ/EryC1/StrS family aminotransferase [Thermoplasmata archaeon]|nr:DegT/DnrJ/EryC1/StrS family aminotransferase [Thermoplasmata archaeon]
MIPQAKPAIGEEEISAVREVLLSGNLAQGKLVKQFEEEFARAIGVKHAIAVANGTCALEIALMCAGVKKGDEVVTTPFTFVATTNAICMTGAKPVYADIEPDTFNISPASIGERITKKTRAILPVHLYGLPANMGEIMKIAVENNLLVIEDACQAHGAKVNGKFVGGIGDIGVFSFYPTKNMTTGEGGMITTNNDEMAEKARIIRNQGQVARYEYSMLGYNYRMTDISAAIGLCQLKKLHEFNRRRKEIAEVYNENLRDVVKIPVTPDGYEHAYHQYTIQTDKREGLREYLTKAEIGTGIYYPKLLYEYPHLNKYRRKCQNAEKVKNTCLSLPIFPLLSDEEVRVVVNTIRRFYGK